MTDQSQEVELETKPAKLHFEIFVAMNEEGDIGYGNTAEEARDALMGDYESLAVRTVALGVAMTPPTIETGPHVDIPDTAGETVEVEPVESTAVDVGQVARIRDILPE